MTDYISRADAISIVHSAIEAEIPFAIVADLIKGLPSADAVSREFYEDAVKANIGLVIKNRELKEQIESAEAVPQLKQTDTLIIADALRYLAKDTERHLVDRTRADALRQQFLKYGASMCKGGEE